MTLTTDALDLSNQCQGTGGYDDIRPGADVTVRDQAGTLIGSSTLAFGTATATSCIFTFRMEHVPEVPFYAVEVSHRGEVTFSLADMQRLNWDAAVTLGE